MMCELGLQNQVGKKMMERVYSIDAWLCTAMVARCVLKKIAYDWRVSVLWRRVVKQGWC